jgi:Flp pilus assembly protein TadG
VSDSTARARWGDDRGSAVAEFAVAFPAVLLVLATVLGAIALGSLQLRLQDAATDAARALARGESASVVADRISRQSAGARWSVARSDGLVCLELRAPTTGPVGALGLQAAARACAWDET